MDSNIDPNIDPTIESQSGIFTKLSINNDYHAQTDNQQVHDDFINQQYIDDNSPNSSNSAAAVAAAAAAAANLSNIINFNHLQGHNESSNTASPPPPHRHGSSNQPRSSSQNQQPQEIRRTQPNNDQREIPYRESLNFIQDTLSNLEDENGEPYTATETSSKQPKQRVIHDANSQVSIVVVNPASTEGTRRLGRPRKHVLSPSGSNSPNISTSQSTNSSQNLNESILSRFRVDSKPVTGPGSRGGRKRSRGIVSKPGRQFKFEKGSKHLKLTAASDDNNTRDEPTIKAQNHSFVKPKSNLESQSSQPPQDDDLIVLDEVQKHPENKTEVSEPKIILEDYHSLKNKGRSTAKDDFNKSAFSRLGLVPQSNKPKKKQVSVKKRKDPPGPLVGAYYDIYDPETISLTKSTTDEDLNKIALGFDVIPAPYAKDIMIILEFINKFQLVLGDFIDLGPQDLEEGLGLRPSTTYSLDNVNQRTIDKLFDETKSHRNNESRLEQLFKKLLSLTMNKKNDLTPSNYKAAIKFLRVSAHNWGLPREWRDDSEIFTVKNLTNEVDTEPVDPENSQLFDNIFLNFGTSEPVPDLPIDNDGLLDEGLNALDPKDRLILLRSLVHWSSANSDIIKNEITSRVQAQDSSLEKETYYVSKFAKEGIKSLEQSIQIYKKQGQKPGKKPTSVSKTATPETENKTKSSSPSNENSLNFADPSYPSSEHPLALRLLTFYAGDGGLTGRFYLCRQSNSQTGPLGGYEDLKNLLEDDRPIEKIVYDDPPTSFKLYVQDVSTMLESVNEQLHSETESSINEPLDPWYEVSGDVESLKKFLDHLSSKISTNRSKQLTNLFNYLNSLLPTLEKFDQISKNGKTISDRTRRGNSDKTLDIFNYKEQGTNDSGDEDHDLEDYEEEFGLIEANNDDDDDGDYIEQQ